MIEEQPEEDDEQGESLEEESEESVTPRNRPSLFIEHIPDEP